ncbi:MAG: hypothetical protein BMS9Abin36_1526 [Gammaproteobacteria bacterium]|nr:MAG: hypothetical protein BMS9Abin36_1526 [Gammaproteobacteria bacterium]
MTDTLERIQNAVEDLKQQRDELHLQMHLFKAEAKDEWGELEKQLISLESRLKTASDKAVITSKEVVTTLGVITKEVGDAYRRIRDRLH